MHWLLLLVYMVLEYNAARWFERGVTHALLKLFLYMIRFNDLLLNWTHSAPKMSDEIDTLLEKDDPIGSNLSVSLPVIILIVLSAYTALFCIFLVMRYILSAKGICVDLQPCGSAAGDAGFCECCVPCVEACNCKVPTIKNLCDACCPQQRLNVGGCLSCQPCGLNGQQCCDCAGFDCVPGYSGEDADAINCICFELRTKPPGDTATRTWISM